MLIHFRLFLDIFLLLSEVKCEARVMNFAFLFLKKKKGFVDFNKDFFRVNERNIWGMFELGKEYYIGNNY